VGGTRYVYRIRANNAGGSSAPSSSVGTYTVPLAPTLTAASASDTQINLTWTNVSGETNYVLQRSADGVSGWTTVASPLANVVGYNHTALTADTNYSYRVMAHNASGDSAASAVVTARTLLAPLAGVTAVGASTTEIDVSWTDTTGESGYRVERFVSGVTWTLAGTTAADVHTFANTGLAAGTLYYYRVRAMNAGGASLAPVNTPATTIPLAPTLTGSVASDTQINLGWSNVAGETNYVLQRSDDGVSGWTTVASPLANVIGYGNTGLTADTSYSYRVLAHNASGDSAASNVVTAHTLLPAVTGLMATGVSTTEIDLSWSNSTGETGYRVERSLDERTWALVTTVGADVTSYANTGLVGGTRYIYRIRANNAGGSSAPSSSASTYTVPLAPSLAGAVVSDTQVNLAWSNVNGETNYVVQRSDDGVSGWATVSSPLANVIGYSNTVLTANTNYSYRVMAHNASGDSAASAVVTVHTLMPVVSGVSAVGASTSEIDLSWTDSTGETGYRVERFVSGVTWALVGTTAADAHTFANTGLVAGTLYYYRIRAVNAGGSSLVPVNTPATTIPLATSLGVTAASTSQIRLSWSNVAGESGYRIERSGDGSTGWSVIGTAAANVIGYTDTGLTTDTPYFYRVTAYNDSGSAASSTVQTTRTLIAAPINLTAVAPSTSQVNLAWTDSTNETGYVIERSLNNGSTWATLASLAANTTSYSNTGLVAGTIYAYRVRAMNAGGPSEPGIKATVTTIPPAVTLTATAVSNGQINLAWNNIAGETGYRVEKSLDGSTWTVLTTTAANVVGYGNAGLTADTLYYYRVTPVNASGSGASTVVNRRTLLSAPTGVTATPASSSAITVSWANQSGETGYRVERLNGATWVLVGTTAADVTTFTNTGLLAGRGYWYRVRAVNSAGYSEATAALAYTPASARPASGAPVFQSKRLIEVLGAAA
jgi:fibronectin type 3 domain-containing protein